MIRHLQLHFILTLLLFASCKGLKTSSSEYEPITQDFSGSFSNVPLESTTRYDDPTLLGLLNLYGYSTETVRLLFIDSTRLLVEFNDSLNYLQEKSQFVFYGEFSNKGFFEIYHHDERKQIPPIIPIIYSSRNIDRIRLVLNSEGDLIVENKWARDGSMLLFLAGGASETYLSHFARVYSHDGER